MAAERKSFLQSWGLGIIGSDLKAIRKMSGRGRGIYANLGLTARLPLAGERKVREPAKSISGGAKRLAVNLALTLGAIAVCLLIIEIGLRLVGITSSNDNLVVYRFDQELGWTPRTNYRHYRSTRYYAHFNYFNSEGFPVERASWHVRLDKTRPTIAIIGDSFAESSYLPYEKSAPFLIGRALVDKQVVNLGVNGYSPGQYLLRARRHLGDYNVTDIVVLFFAFNDVPFVEVDSFHDYSKPYFDIDVTQPVNLPLKIKGNRWWKRITSSGIYALLRPYIYKPVSEWRHDSGYARLSPGSMAKALALIRQIAVEFPVPRFHVVYIPYILEIEQDGVLDSNLQPFFKNCRRLELACYFPGFFTEPDPGLNEIYIVGDGHLTEFGSRKLANYIVENVLARRAGGFAFEHREQARVAEGAHTRRSFAPQSDRRLAVRM